MSGSGSATTGPRSRSFGRPDGLAVWAHDFGGSGPPLLLTHAAGFCGGAYAPLIAGLLDRFRVVAVDLAGHGDSPAPADGRFSWEDMAHDLLAVQAGLGLGPAALFGHSLGGGVGLRAAALRPAWFTGVYAYEPAVLPEMDGVDRAGIEMSARVASRRAVFGSRAEAVERLARRPPFDTWCTPALDAFARYGLRDVSPGEGGGVALKCPPSAESAVYRAARKIGVEQVAGVRVPVRIAVGGRDGGLPALAAPLICRALPDARLSHHPRLGHLGPFEDPAAVAADAAAHLGPRQAPAPFSGAERAVFARPGEPQTGRHV